MEEKIQKVNKTLHKCYIVFWLLPILIGLGGEFDIIPNGGLFTGNAAFVYGYQFMGILLAVCLVPVALKLFQWTLVKKIDTLPFADALRKYGKTSIIRLALLAVVVVFNLIAYYLIASTTCLFCAAIALAMSLFCIPSDRRLREELHLTTNDKDNDPL
jgi:hypothetical protein